MSDSYDSVIIGAGIIGAATALALARKGRRPLVIDRLRRPVIVQMPQAAGRASRDSSRMMRDRKR